MAPHEGHERREAHKKREQKRLAEHFVAKHVPEDHANNQDHERAKEQPPPATG